MWGCEIIIIFGSDYIPNIYLMNNHLLSRALLIIMVLVASTCFAATPKKKEKPIAPKPIDIAATVDSAVIMADDYAIALEQNPEMAPTRLKQLQNFAKSKSPEVNDSICSRLYDFFVTYTENEKSGRAEAFKKCFLALASEVNPNLGPLYATDLYISIVENDTIAVKAGIEQLQLYSTRLNLDYDEEIWQAEEFIKEVRQRKPIRYDIMGCWVGESICEDKFYIPSFKETWITDIDGNKEKYNNLSRSMHILRITSSCVYTCFPYKITYADFPDIGYSIPPEAYNKNIEKYLKNRQSKSRDNSDKKDNHIEYNEKDRSAYCLWCSEDLSSFNPQYYAMLRQNMQADYANTAGELSRSYVSNGTKLKGKVIMDGMYRIGNSIFDRLAVSTASAWIKEMTLRLDAPTRMTVWTHIQYNISKSNSNRVNTWDKENNGTLYLKWEPDDDVFFLAQNGDFITLGELTSAQKKEKKEIVKGKKDEYQSSFGKIGMSNKKYDEFRRWFNTYMFNKLKTSKR